MLDFEFLVQLQILLADGEGVELGGVAGLGRRLAGGRGRGTGGGEIDAEGHSADRQDVAGLERLLPEDSLAVDEGPVGTAQVLDHELPLVLEDLAMTTADLRGADPDQAVVVATDAVDSIHQLQRGRLASAADDLENVIHLVAIPAGWGV